MFLFLVERQIWSKASSVAEAYQIGRAESTAALNLKKHTEPKIVAGLQDLVQTLCAVC